ncbi:MAG: hypothetical protein ACRDWN_09705 [Acidimicrobiales bacterium]
MTELTVVIPDEVADRLKEAARARGASAEELVAEVLELHLRAPTRRRPSFVASGHSGRHDLSERAEELLDSLPRE